MELKGARPGEFHPRCTACKTKFKLFVHSDASAAPVVSLEANDEAVSNVVAHALGVNPREMPPSAAIAARPARAAASTHATMPAAPRAALRSNIAATAIGLAHAEAEQVQRAHEMPSQIDESPPYDDDPVLPGQTLGGYQIQQKLGQGGMGAVYLARQLSLDRNVALKILSPTLSRDPQFVARFTREAYAAAQLSHHNVVQIHDIGAEHDVNFFSMEFVEGKTLSHLVADVGKVDVEQSVGFTLQAARGLKYAHDHGLIHRDIKPENLLLNEAGIVKVADLGLVKRAGLNETAITAVPGGSGANSPDKTQVNMSMGTPAYMSPEQAQDAAHVDQRADIYSLGCTFYDLLTGRPPFIGRTALEVITKHQREQIVPPDVVVKNVPRTLSIILMKMVAKKPEQRYQTMGEVITALEDFLGVATTGPFTPKEEHVKVLEFAVERFNKSMYLKIHRLTIGLFFLVCAALAIFIGLTRQGMIARVQFTGAFVGLAVMTTLSYVIIAGTVQKTPLFLRLRQLIFGATMFDFLMWAAISCLAIGALVIFDQSLGWIIVTVIAILLAAGFVFSIDLMLSRDRATPIIQAEHMLKQMRLRGLEENSLRQFVSKYSGKRWEEFYEALFGYDAKMQARQLWGRGERGLPRPKFAAWRDPIIRAIEARLAHRRELREQKVLARVEARAMRSKGINDKLAAKQAMKNAQRMVAKAEELRNTKAARAAATMLPPSQVVGGMTAAPTSANDTAVQGAIASMMRGGAGPASGAQASAQLAVEDDSDRVHESWFKRRYGTPIDFLAGSMVRFVLAVLVMLTFSIWFKQNSGDQAAREAAKVIESRREVDVTGQLSDWKRNAIAAGNAAKEGATVVATNTGSVPLRLFPDTWTGANSYAAAFGGWNAGLAGLLLLISIFFHGRLLALTVVTATVVILYGHYVDLPVIGYRPLQWMSAAAGGLLWLFGVFFFRVREGY